MAPSYIIDLINVKTKTRYSLRSSEGILLKHPSGRMKKSFGKLRQQLLKINHCSVRVGTIDIKPVKVVRNLGAWFDSHFSMSTHISKSCSAAFFWLHNIKSISQFLPRDKLEMVLHAFVTSRIDYCNGLLYGLLNCKEYRTLQLGCLCHVKSMTM